MKVDKDYIQAIVNTLPIGYYISKNISVTLDESTSTSYVNLISQEIVIATKNVYSAIDKIDQSKLTEQEVEQIVRGILYHELAHVILTPTYFKYADYVNIFEDERIETILAHYFMGVNFKRNLFLIVGFDKNKKPKSGLELFYNVVRFRNGPKGLVDRVSEIIKYNTKDIKYNYVGNIKKLYDDCLDYFDQNIKEDQPKAEENQDKEETNTEESIPGNTEENQDKEETNTEESIPGNTEENQDKEETNTEESNPGNTEENQNVEDQLENTEESNPGNTEENQNVEDQLEKIEQEINKTLESLELDDFSNIQDFIKNEVFSGKVLNHQKIDKIFSTLYSIVVANTNYANSFGASSNGYTGKINPKLVGTKSNYQWFVKSNNGNYVSNTRQKTHFTLWVDCSGSFRNSEKELNCLLAAIYKFEKVYGTKFSYDLVLMGSDIKIAKKNQYIYCAQGNYFSDISKIVATTTKQDCKNYNIMVWDGNLATDNHSWDFENIKRWISLLDNHNTIIISDSVNKKYLNHLTKAKIKFMKKNYSSVFINTITTMIKKVCR